MGASAAIIGSALIGAGTSAYSSKKQRQESSKTRNEARKTQEQQKIQQEQEKKKQNQASKDYYTGLRRGNINLLNPTSDQKLG